MNKHILPLLLAALILSTLFYSCNNTRTTDHLVVLYDKEFDYVKERARKERRVFCIILSRPDCPPCQHYIKHLGELYRDVTSNVMFNIVDVSLPENHWYMHWLVTGGSPTTCVFSPRGELRAVVPGVTKSAIECVRASIAGNARCADYFHQNHFSADGNPIQLLNALLTCKQNLNNGKDISKDIEPYLEQTNHPYAIYLKALNEKEQGRVEKAAFWAERFLSNVNAGRYYSRVYANLVGQVNMIIDPNYIPGEAGVLSVVDELPLGNRKFQESTPFSLTVSNTGQSPLSVFHVEVGCSCLRLLSDARQTIQPGEARKLNFTFTADIRGDVSRNIVFVSNGVNPVETVKITARVR